MKNKPFYVLNSTEYLDYWLTYKDVVDSFFIDRRAEQHRIFKNHQEYMKETSWFSSMINKVLGISNEFTEDELNHRLAMIEKWKEDEIESIGQHLNKVRMCENVLLSDAQFEMLLRGKFIDLIRSL